MADHIRYDLLTQQALRAVVRQVLTDAAKKGLPGDHHFYITFDTHADGVRLSDRLRTQYPEEMTVILQHQFWDLTVTEQGFEVGMSFGGIPEKLFIPFAAICGFFDPSVQFGLQFEEIVAGDDKPLADQSAGKQRLPVAVAPPASVPTVKKAAETTAEPPNPDKPSGGGEVVRLDRFRKK